MSDFKDRLRNEVRSAPADIANRVRASLQEQRSTDDEAHQMLADLRGLVRANLDGELSDQKFKAAVIRLAFPKD